jgi:hypothetical protein
MFHEDARSLDALFHEESPVFGADIGNLHRNLEPINGESIDLQIINISVSMDVADFSGVWATAAGKSECGDFAELTGSGRRSSRLPVRTARSSSTRGPSCSVNLMAWGQFPDGQTRAPPQGA